VVVVPLIEKKEEPKPPVEEVVAPVDVQKYGTGDVRSILYRTFAGLLLF
jgi:hypothetical protein